MTEQHGKTKGSVWQGLATAMSLVAAAGALYVSALAYDRLGQPSPPLVSSGNASAAPVSTLLPSAPQGPAANAELTRLLDQLGQQISAEQQKCKGEDLQDCRQRNFPISAFLEARIIAATRHFKVQQTLTREDEHRRTQQAPVLSSPDRSQLLTVLVLAKFDMSRLLPFANFDYADLRGIKAEEISLEKGQLEHTNFSHARFDGINLEEARLAYSDFSYAILNGARLRFADLSNADLTCTDLTTADFEPADIQGANNWQKAVYSEQQRLQLGLNQPSDCPPVN